MEGWDEYQKLVQGRLEEGEREYGNKSFSLPPAKLLHEIEEELLDINVWSFILWTRIRRLQDL